MTQTKTAVDSATGKSTDDLVGGWLSLSEAAIALGLNQNKTKQLIRDHKLLGIAYQGSYRIPAIFIQDKQVVKGLSGTLTLLADAGFNEADTLRWLFTDDDTLPGTPAQALAENRGTEIRRRAQALAF